MPARKVKRGFKVGDRVRFKYYRRRLAWGDRTPQQFGFITRIDGAYIYVRPRWRPADEVFELYDWEIAPATANRKK
jgi:hypothetical protein